MGLFVIVGLAGCTQTSSDANPALGAKPALAADRGAITGLVIDDRYRPVPDALVLLTPGGLTATTDSEGQFRFGDLRPGAYLLIVQAKDHEAAPKNADVLAGEYTDVEAMARRVFSDNGNIITTEYSVFIPCDINFVANGVSANCVADLSGDTYRPGFYADYTPQKKNATYLITEMLANQKTGFEAQVRCESAGKYYAVYDLDEGNYIRMTMVYGNVSPDAPVPVAFGANNKWDNKCKDLHTLLFSEGAGRKQIQDTWAQNLGGTPLGPSEPCCGAGATFGIKAKFVASLFIGTPSVDVTTYAVLRPAA